MTSRSSSPERPGPCTADAAAPLHWPAGVAPRSLHLFDGLLVHGRVEMHGRLLSCPFGPSPWGGLGNPKPSATMAAADFSRRDADPADDAFPFQGSVRSPRVRHIGCPCMSAGYTVQPLIVRASRFHARSPWSAPPRLRFLYVAPQVSLAAAFSTVLTDSTLRFARVGTISSPQDLHLLVNGHAGHTWKLAALAFCSIRPLVSYASYGARAGVDFQCTMYVH
ncbi:hypothetical protein BH11GEM2_BH11GEM2_01010 [soil metagenome]